MDVETLEERLQLWANWAVRGCDYGLGYPKKTVEARLREGGGLIIHSTGAYYASENPQAERIEKAIRELATYNKKQADILRASYLMVGTQAHIAKRCRLSYTHFRQQVMMAKQWLAGRLKD